jgi:hypothetical protein
MAERAGPGPSGYWLDAGGGNQLQWDAPEHTSTLPPTRRGTGQLGGAVWQD